MHELSIALRIVETLAEELVDEAGSVKCVRIRVGAFSGVVPEALLFAWDVACKDSRVRDSRLEIEEVAASIWCDSCNCEQTLPSTFRMRCPICGQTASRLTAGRELEILSVEMADDAEIQVY